MGSGLAICEIKSPDNKFLKLAKSLKLKKYRDEYKLFTVEGDKSCIEIIKANAKVPFAFITENFCNEVNGKFLKNIEAICPKVFKLSGKLFNTITTEETPGGILLIVEKQIYKLDDLLKNQKQFVLILDKIQDPGNLGTIIRTAVAFRLSGIILTEGTVDVYNPKVVRASSGFLFNIPVLENVNIKEIIKALSGLNFLVLATDSKKGKDIKEIELKFPLALIIGNEGKGLDEEVQKLSMNCVKVSISDRVDSLNASVSAGILIYETVNKERE